MFTVTTKTSIILHEIDHVLKHGVKLHVDRLGILRSQIEDNLDEQERVDLSNKIRNAAQLEALSEWYKFNGWGCIFGATGFGKSRVGVLAACATKGTKVLIVVPTAKLRDVEWPNEIKKWGCYNLIENIEICCYAGLKKYKGQTFDLLILDEGHNITVTNESFFKENTIKTCMMMTATRPTDQEKIQIYKNLKMQPVYELGVDECVKLGLINPYDITIVTMSLDDTIKYIEAGTKGKKFKTTEKQTYAYLTKVFENSRTQVAALKRMHFLYNLKSKTDVAKLLLKNVIPEDIRTLIFAGSISQCIEVCDRRYFSKPSIKKSDPPEKKERAQEILKSYEGDKGFNDFIAGLINRLSCVDALNEGINAGGVDCALVIQIDSNNGNFIQRLGRIIRYRPGKIGKVIVICIKDTVDMDWMLRALKGLNALSVRIVNLEDLRTGKERILF